MSKKRVAHWYVVMTGNAIAEGNEMIANHLDTTDSGGYENQFPELEIKRKGKEVKQYTAWEVSTFAKAQAIRSAGKSFGYGMFIARRYEGAAYAEEWTFVRKRRSPNIKKMEEQIEALSNSQSSM